MEFVVWLDRVGKDDGNSVGGKGANLGEMIKLGIPVPSGFVVTTAGFDRLMQMGNLAEEIKKKIDSTNVDDTKQLIEASNKIKEMITVMDFPAEIKTKVVEAYKSLSYSDKVFDEKFISLISAGRELALVAVRSSATTEDLPTASFAGQQASFLNVKGTKDLLDSIKKCWASLFEPRAIFYRAKHGFAHASIAVIVQRMVNSDKSGVMFTVDPTTGDNKILIEATWGLGESLVLGEVSPDSYKVEKESGKVVEAEIGNKTKMRIRDYASELTVEVNVPRNKVNAPVLSEDEIARLARFGGLLESHYGSPQDIEFAIERSTIRIVQTRAITTEAKVRKGGEEIKIEGKEVLRGIGASPGIASGKIKIVKGLQDISKIAEGDILVTTMTSPDLVPTMDKSAAIITDLGGKTSHAAIVSREMGIPAVVGTQVATKVLKDGDVVTVDAYNGIIFSGKVFSGKAEFGKPVAETAAPFQEIALQETRLGETVTRVKVNLAFPENLEAVSKKTDGVGLLRIEHMITKFGIHPAKLVREGRAEDYIKILIEGITPVAEAFKQKPVWVRSLDARSDEFRNLQGGEDEPKEDNPMLGWHGVRRGLDEPDLLKAEFEAAKRLHEKGLTNIHLMLPFVISADELRRAREVANQVGIPESLRMGIMVETPAAALSIEEFCKEGVDFVSFGTNDLTQLTLGVDRNNAKIAGISSEFHPAVLKMMKEVIGACNRYNIESSICGEAGSNPEMAKILVRYGIGSISCNIDAIDAIRKVVFETERQIVLESRKHVNTE